MLIAVAVVDVDVNAFAVAADIAVAVCVGACVICVGVIFYLLLFAVLFGS